MKRTLFLVFCFLALGVVQAQIQSVPPDLKQIIGGAPVGWESFPFVVYIDVGGFCTGTLIHSNWVMTAAHCVVEGDGSITTPDYVERGYPTETEAVHEIGRVVPHPEYDYSGAGFKNDIALIELLEPFKSSGAVPIRLLTPEERVFHAPSGTLATAVGYGRKENNEWSDGLRQVEIPLLTPEDCRRHYDFLNEVEIVHDRTLCAGSPGKGINSGDSGGPLIVPIGQTWGQVGVASIRGRNRSGQPVVSVYTRVPLVYDWIQEETGQVPTTTILGDSTWSCCQEFFFPDFVNGDGWSVQLAVTNMYPRRTVQGRVVVLVPGPVPSEPDTFPLFGEDPLFFNIPARGTRVFKTDGSGDLARGVIHVSGGPDFNPLAATLIYQHQVTGLEVSVSPSEYNDEYRLLVEESDSIGTGLAIGKTWGTKVCIAVIDVDGLQVKTDSQPYHCYGPVAEGGVESTDNFLHSARSIQEWVPDIPLPLEFVGSVRVYRSRFGAPSSFLVQGMRFSKDPSRPSLSALPAAPSNYY